MEAGPIRFGIEFRELGSDRGIAMHVMGDVGDEEKELLTFDCFENDPHYHYGPRAKNQRLLPRQDRRPRIRCGGPSTCSREARSPRCCRGRAMRTTRPG